MRVLSRDKMGTDKKSSPMTRRQFVASSASALAVGGRADVPVAPRAKSRMLRRLVTAVYAHGDNGLAGAVFPEPTLTPVGEHAAIFIQRTVRGYPGEVTLITIGPLTNVASALNSDRELAGRVRT